MAPKPLRHPTRKEAVTLPQTARFTYLSQVSQLLTNEGHLDDAAYFGAQALKVRANRAMRALQLLCIQGRWYVLSDMSALNMPTALIVCIDSASRTHVSRRIDLFLSCGPLFCMRVQAADAQGAVVPRRSALLHCEGCGVFLSPASCAG